MKKNRSTEKLVPVKKKERKKKKSNENLKWPKSDEFPCGGWGKVKMGSQFSNFAQEEAKNNFETDVFFILSLILIA